LPNFTMYEDTSNFTIDLDDYFYDSDNHDLNWSVFGGVNLTVIVDNNTGVLNVTPDVNYYGVTNFTVGASDGYGGLVNSSLVIVTVTNVPEVSLSYPVDGAQIQSNTSIQFKITAEDVYGMENCSVLLNGVVNITQYNITTSQSTEMSDDDGSRENMTEIGRYGANLTKTLNVTLPPNQIKLYLLYTGSGANVDIEINGSQHYTLTSVEIQNQLSADTYGWVTKTVNSSGTTPNEFVNITLSATYGVMNHIKAGIDNDTDVNRSYLNVSGIGGEFMIRLVNDNSTVTFDAVNLSKGTYAWNAQCVNNQTVIGTASANYTLYMNNSAPTTPTYLLPTSGTYDDEINVSCGGSSDFDGDGVYYDLEYKITEWTQLVSNDSDGNYTWNVSSINPASLKLRCKASDGTADSNYNTQSQYNLDIYHPGAPTTPNNLTCDGLNCSNQVLANVTNLTCSGSNNSVNYVFEADYEDENGTSFKTIAVDADGNYTWNLSSVYSQNNFTIRCFGSSASWNSTFYATNNVSINNSGAPNTPVIFTPTSGDFNWTVPITCNGSGDPLGGSVTYNVFAYYDSKEYLINSTLTNTTIFYWNTTSVTEGRINLSCQAKNAQYVSPILRAGQIELVREPTMPTIVMPDSGVYEYGLDYNCSGSNNGNYFLNRIDAYYDNGTSEYWHSMNDSYPGVLAVNNSALAANDGVLSSLSHWGYQQGWKFFSLNVTNGNYLVCANGSGTGTGAEFKFKWGCTGASCTYEHGFYTDLSSSYVDYCFDINLNTSGMKNFILETYGAGSSSQVTTSFDSVIFYAKSLAWNVTSVTAQDNVSLRCQAYDGAGNSSWLYGDSFIIDRYPVYNGSSQFTFVKGNFTTFNISKLFYDTDGQVLNFTIDNSSAANINVSYNFSVDYNVTLSDLNWAGYRYLVLNASDGLTSNYSNVTIFSNPCGDGTCNYGEVSGTTNNYDGISYLSCMQDCGVDVTNVETGGGGGGSSGPLSIPAETTVSAPSSPSINIPTPTATPPPTTGGSKPREEGPRVVVQSEVLDKVLDKRFTHGRVFMPQFGRTQIIETVSSVTAFAEQDVVVEVDFPKHVIETTDELTPVDEFEIIQRDPKIAFYIDNFNPYEEKQVKYVVNKELTAEQVAQIAISVLPKELSEEERVQREKDYEEMVKKTEEVVDVTTDYVINDDGSADILINVDLLDETKTAKGLSIIYDIPKCLIELLTEEFRKEGVESNIDFNVVEEDPLTTSHLGDLDEDRQLKISLKQVADGNCTDKITAYAVAMDIIPKYGQLETKKALYQWLVFIVVCLGLLFFTGHVLERRMKSGARKHPKLNKSMKIFHDIILVGVVLFLIALNVGEVFGYLSGDVSFLKKLISWALVGYLVYKVSMTEILFGVRRRFVDFMLVIVYFFILFNKTIGVFQKSYVGSSSSTSQAILLLLQPGSEIYAFLIGFVSLVLISVYITYVIKFRNKSVVSLLGVRGWKFAKVFLLLSLFYVGVYQLMMEWMTLAVDSIMVFLLLIVVVYMVFRRSQHRKREALEKPLELPEKVYEKIFGLFHYHKTIFLGLSALLLFGPLTDVLIFIIPYMTGLEGAEIYFSKLQFLAGHNPIFNFFHWGEGLFAQQIAGMSLHAQVVLAFLFLMNALALVFILVIPIYYWYKMYSNRDLPVKLAEKVSLPRYLLALFGAAITTFILAPAFKFKAMNQSALAGVDITTTMIDGVFRFSWVGLIVVSTVLVYGIYHILKEKKDVIVSSVLITFCIMYLVLPLINLNPSHTVYLYSVFFISLAIGGLIYIESGIKKRVIEYKTMACLL
ncbi:hypothetical protein ACFLYT_01020, partial [Nanoarchaeota archaeon]